MNKKKINKIIFAVVLGTIIICAYSSYSFIQFHVSQLPEDVKQLQSLTSSSLAYSTEVFDRKGRKIGEFSAQKRIYTPLNKLPKHVIQAFLSAEDKDFYSHIGIDPPSIVRAMSKNLQKGHIVQGASTITQQLARISFLNDERSYGRKIKEAFLALAIEKKLTKDEILELYLNKIYLGNHSFGIEAAAINYFRKSASKLNIGEAALLAGLPKAPSANAPHRHYSRAKKRQRQVLIQMYKNSFLKKSQVNKWISKKILVYKKPKSFLNAAPYFLAEVEKQLKKKFELENLSKLGLKVYTSLDLDLQNAARKSLESLRSQSKNAKAPHIEGAVVSIDASTGAILAMQGGSSFSNTQFNRALYTKRPLGASYLPLYNGLALDNGYSLATPVDIEPHELKNIDKSKSQFPNIFNIILNNDIDNGIILFAALGTGGVAKYSRQLGFKFNIFDLRLALGRGMATPLQLSKAYGTIANGGTNISPYYLEKIETRNGDLIYKRTKREKDRILSHESTEILTSALKDNVSFGSASLLSNSLENLSAVMSVSQDLKNSWMVAYKGSVVTSFWMGAERGVAIVASSKKKSFKKLASLWYDFYKSSPEKFWLDKNIKHGNLSYSQIEYKSKEGKKEKKSVPFIMGTLPNSKIKF